MKFQVYHEGEPWDGSKGYRWRLVARNGRIIADSGEAYSTRGNAHKACHRLVMALSTGETYGYGLPIVDLPDA